MIDLKYGLYVMNVDGTNKRTLEEPSVPIDMDQHLNALAYTADGARILYQSAVPIDRPDGCCQLWVMNADGSDPARFVHDPGAGWEGEASILTRRQLGRLQFSDRRQSHPARRHRPG